LNIKEIKHSTCHVQSSSVAQCSGVTVLFTYLFYVINRPIHDPVASGVTD